MCIKGSVQMKDNHEKVIEGFYQYIGQCHVENVIEDFDNISKNAHENIIPTELDEWFSKYVLKAKKIERSKLFWHRFNSISKRVAIFTVLFGISVLVTTMSVDAFRIKLFNIFVEVTEKYTSMSITEKNKVVEEVIKWESYFAPEFIPDGYELSNNESFGDVKIIYYLNDKGDEIQFSQSPVNLDFQIDTENAFVIDVKIKGNKGVLVEKNNISTLIWTTEDNTFYVIGKVNRESLIKIAESLDFFRK